MRGDASGVAIMELEGEGRDEPSDCGSLPSMRVDPNLL
jgi:hypothetical protein